MQTFYFASCARLKMLHSFEVHYCE